MEYVQHGYCGVFCGACPVLLATKEGTISPEKECFGCKSQKPTGFCATCGIKACARQNGFGFCSQCKSLKSCDLMKAFTTDTQYPYGQCVLKNMETIQITGLLDWLAWQGLRWKCAKCGTSHSWYDQTCAKCGAAVDNYQADF